MKTLTLFLALACTATLFAQEASPDNKGTGVKPAASASANAGGVPTTPLPSRAEGQAALERTLGYASGMRWQILDIRPSGIPGLPEAIISFNKQPSIHLYITPDGQNAIVGSIIPFGADPFASARAKLEAADAPRRGVQDPDMLIVEFCDLESPHGKATQAVLKKLLVDFPQVQWTLQQFPLPESLHPWAKKAALYADCAGRVDKDCYWKFVDSIFENQDQITVANVDDKLKELAGAAGLNAEELAASTATPEAEASVQKSLALGQSLNVDEVPTVFINGRRVLDMANIPYEQLKELVQFEVNHAGK